MQNLCRIVRFWVKRITFGKNVAFSTLIILWYGAIADFGADASYGDRKWNDESPEVEFLCFPVTLKLKSLFIFS